MQAALIRSLARLALIAMKCLRPIQAWLVGKTENGRDKYSFSCPSMIGCRTVFFPCGKCSACLESRRSAWVSRCRLESLLHTSNSFVTLTYNDRDLPKDRLCNKRDIQLFLKKLRNAGRDNGFLLPSFRYICVGEYGLKYGRPHYHMIVFGVDMLSRSWLPSLALWKQGYPVFTSSVLSDCWSKGFVTVDQLTDKSLRYVSKYVTKQFSGRSPFVMFSQGLGRGHFVNIENRRVVSAKPFLLSCGYHDCFRFSENSSPLPRSAVKYLQKFYPDIYEDLKSKRHAREVSASINECLADCSQFPLDNRQSSLDFRSMTEKQKRKLDDEC